MRFLSLYGPVRLFISFDFWHQRRHCCTAVCSPSFRARVLWLMWFVVVRPSHPADTLIRSVRVQVQGCGRSLVVHRSTWTYIPARHNFLVACGHRQRSNPIHEIAWVCRAVPVAGAGAGVVLLCRLMLARREHNSTICERVLLQYGTIIRYMVSCVLLGCVLGAARMEWIDGSSSLVCVLIAMKRYCWLVLQSRRSGGLPVLASGHRPSLVPVVSALHAVWSKPRSEGAG